jgi:2-dehydro-3-deoxy-D-arabinonate dehydratase
MQIFRYADNGEARIGVIDDDGRRGHLPVRSLGELLRLSLDDIRALVEAVGEFTSGSTTESIPEPIRLLPPIDGRTEVWASGVTYQRSSDARQEESVAADVYARVYDAVRPELFFKSQAWRVVATMEPIGVRPRSIEGENPLYLPQAKVYTGSCAIGPTIRPSWEIREPYALGITVRVSRGGIAVWDAQTNTSLLHRRFHDMVEHLYRSNTFPDGAVLSTGTGLVPDLTFTLEPGDVVLVTIDGIGTLVNHVRTATHEHFGWLSPDPARTQG